MPGETPRSADILRTDLNEKITTDGKFRDKVRDDPAAAVEEIKILADSAKSQVDAADSRNAKALEAKVANTAASADWWVYIIAVAALGFVAVMVVISIYWIASPQVNRLTEQLLQAAGGDPSKLKEVTIAFAIPDGLIALGSAAIGALAGLLGPLSQRGS